MRALIADDQPDVVEALRLLLKQEGYQIETANSPAAVLANLSASNITIGKAAYRRELTMTLTQRALAAAAARAKDQYNG